MSEDLDRIRKLAGLNEAKEEPEERWMKNFINIGSKMYLAVEVVAAEANGWRVNSGFSKGGKVIEDTAYILKSEWVKTFEGAEKLAKVTARGLKLKWKPKPYGNQ